MLVIGLTGGIGCGKTAVTERFAELGVPVIDADRVAREVVEPGQPALEKIRLRFGDEMLRSDGDLKRDRLRELIFSDEQARLELEAILHPLIRQRMRDRLKNLEADYAILAIPLLLETGQSETVDRILVVDCPEETQIRRVCSRDGISGKRVRKILSAQSSRRERLAAADDVIDNSGSLTELTPRILALHRSYLALARS